MTIKKIATIGSILAGLALSANVAWANCGVGRTAISTQISCQTNRGNFVATGNSAASPSSSVRVSLSTGIDSRSREARSAGFNANGIIQCTAIVFRNTGNASAGTATVPCSQPVVTHDLSLTASLFPG